jgi:hypothetical protein
MLADQSIDRFRSIEHRFGVAYALVNKAQAAARLNRHEAVDASVTEAFDICSDANLHLLAPALLAARARSRLARGQNAASIEALMAARRVQTLLETAPSNEDVAQLEAIETELRGKYMDHLFPAAQAAVANLTVDEVLRKSACGA